MGRAALAGNVGAAPRGPSEEEGSERSRSHTNEMASSATAEATAVAQTTVRRQRQHSLEVAASPLSFSRVGGRIPSSILLVVMAVASSITLSCTYLSNTSSDGDPRWAGSDDISAPWRAARGVGGEGVV